MFMRMAIQVSRTLFGILTLGIMLQSGVEMERTTLYVGGLFELTEHWWSSYTNLFPLILENAFDTVMNNSAILRDYDIKLIGKDTKGQNGNAAKQMIELIEEGPPKVAIFGPGLSDELTVTGQIAPFYNVIELSYVATTATTVDQRLFPTLFTVNQVTKVLNPLRIKMMQFFGWSRVGTIAYQDDMSTAQMNDFHEMLQENNMTLVTSAVISDSANIKDVISRFKAYRQGIYGTSHVWILSGPTMYANWVNNAVLDGLNCARDDLITASNGHFTLDYHKISTSVLPTIAGKTGTEIMDELRQIASQTPYKLTSYAGWIYDSAWALALGLNNSLKYLDEAGLSLDNYSYSSEFLDAILMGMSEVTFRGASGPVSFDEYGSRIGVTYIQQNYNDTKADVASFDVLYGNLTWLTDIGDLWQGGVIPQDSFIYQQSVVNISEISFGFIVCIAVVGCILTIGFLSFNIYYRNNRSIKMSSPMINNVIIAGCIIMYVQVIITAYDFKYADLETGEKMCMVRVWAMAIGFTSLFGAMFSKTYRVYVIFRDSKLKAKIIRDVHLFGLIGLLLLFDCILLIPWTLLFPLETDRHVELSKDISDQNVIYSKVYLYCHNAHQGYWFAAIYVYKGLLLAFGTFLAWETRKVKVSALNDSKYIGGCIYNVVIMCIFGVPMAHMLPIDQTTLGFVLSCGLILFCTTLCQCILFIPKIQTRNQVHGRFLMTTDNSTNNGSNTAASTAFTNVKSEVAIEPAHATTCNTCEHTMEELKTENEALRMQVANESIAMAKLKRSLLETTGNLHLYKSGTDYILFKANSSESRPEDSAHLEEIA